MRSLIKLDIHIILTSNLSWLCFIQSMKKHMSVKDRAAADRRNHQLGLWLLDTLPQEVCKGKRMKGWERYFNVDVVRYLVNIH